LAMMTNAAAARVSTLDTSHHHHLLHAQQQQHVASPAMTTASAAASPNNTSENKWSKNGYGQPCARPAKNGKFTAEETILVRQSIEEYCKSRNITSSRLCSECDHKAELKGAWMEIARALPHRTVQSVYRHGLRQLHPFKRGPWTDAECTDLLNLVHRLGKKWAAIQSKLNRSADQCRDKYREMSADYIKGRWNEFETKLLFQLVKEHLGISSININSSSKSKKDGKGGGSTKDDPYGLATIREISQMVERDEIVIPWSTISKRMVKRSRLSCFKKWQKMTCAANAASGGGGTAATTTASGQKRKTASSSKSSSSSSKSMKDSSSSKKRKTAAIKNDNDANLNQLVSTAVATAAASRNATVNLAIQSIEEGIFKKMKTSSFASALQRPVVIPAIHATNPLVIADPLANNTTRTSGTYLSSFRNLQRFKQEDDHDDDSDDETYKAARQQAMKIVEDVDAAKIAAETLVEAVDLPPAGSLLAKTTSQVKNV